MSGKSHPSAVLHQKQHKARSTRGGDSAAGQSVHVMGFLEDYGAAVEMWHAESQMDRVGHRPVWRPLLPRDPAEYADEAESCEAADAAMENAAALPQPGRGPLPSFLPRLTRSAAHPYWL